MLACALWILLVTTFQPDGGFVRTELGRYDTKPECLEAAERVEGLARCERAWR